MAGNETTSTECKRKILISVDGSEHSERAFYVYLNKVRKAGDLVIVFHAQETTPVPPNFPYGMAYRDDWRDYTEQTDEEAKCLLRHFGALLKEKPDITFKLVKESGTKPGELICKNIQEEGVDLVIMGSRGRGTVRRTILGSVSDYVVHNCLIPVCVVPPESQS